MSAFAVFKRWPIATWLFTLHTAIVAATYIWWAISSSVERDMIWMTVFLLDLPSSYLFLGGSGAIALYAASAIVIGGLQWLVVGSLLDLLRRVVKRTQQQSRN